MCFFPSMDTHTCLASLRWELEVGRRRLMETGRTHSEYWWDAVQITQKCDSDTHTHTLGHRHIYTTSTFVIPVMTCSRLHLSLIYFDTKSIVVMWMPTKLRMPAVVASHTGDKRGEDGFTSSIHHSVIELSPVKSCWMCAEWGRLYFTSR